MTAITVILSVIYVLLAIVLVAAVILQSGKNNGLSGAIGGGSGETFLSKNKAKSLDAKLAKMTKWIAIAFIVLTLVISIVL